ncbi:hypothetical protein IV203_004132 [Nitzschia inconspicua]|uniref:Uncharacterized protein n=1 Tax=Nitzschia inconspicua TaxID=303405 RepID=A0A9K3PPV1_9STRA|nr:hypothetical protein IV203_004132 [Nitzschia inconspicua]
MLQVDVENNRVLFCAEGIPIHEPLLGGEERSMATKKKSVAWGCFLLSIATFSTVAIILFFALFAKDADLDPFDNNSTNSTSYTSPFDASGQLAIKNVSSPQFKAMEWMKGKKVVTTSEFEIFSLATLFFATNGVHWTAPFDFLSKDTSICEWNDGQNGIFCDEKNHTVKTVLLDGLGLDGSIPDEIVYLTNLEVLHLGNNLLVGNLPEGMASMKSLTTVSLKGNRPSFAGNINDVLCRGASIIKLKSLIIGEDCPLPVCLCCNDCPK